MQNSIAPFSLQDSYSVVKIIETRSSEISAKCQKNPRKISKGNKNILYLYSLPRVKPNIPPLARGSLTKKTNLLPKVTFQNLVPETSIQLDYNVKRQSLGITNANTNTNTVELQREMTKLGNNKCKYKYKYS